MIENPKCSSTPNFPHNPQQPQSYILAVMRLIRMAQCWVGCRDDTTEIRGGSCQWSGGCYGMLSLRSLSELRDPGMVWTKQPPVLSSYLISHISYLISNMISDETAGKLLNSQAQPGPDPGLVFFSLTAFHCMQRSEDLCAMLCTKIP